MDTLDLSCVPYEESCAQVGQDNYSVQARKECRAYINQLKREFGEPPDGAFFKVMSNPHDFGSYYSVVIKFDGNDEAQVNYAYKCESEGPAEWDDEAREELNSKHGVSRSVEEMARKFAGLDD